MCFLAGAPDDSKIDTNPYQCLDCLLKTPGVESWGCSVFVLNEWCQLVAEEIETEKDPTGLKKAEVKDLDKEIESPKTDESEKHEIQAMEGWEGKHETDTRDADVMADTAMSPIVQKLNALLRAHPNLRKQATSQMTQILQAEKDIGSINDFDTLKKAQSHLSADKAAAMFKNASPDNLLDDKNDEVGGVEDHIRPSLRATLVKKFARVTKHAHRSGR
jgi:hypothetical protein